MGVTYTTTVTEEVLREVEAERRRQEQLKAQGRFKYTCADSEMSASECLAVLGEEVGETFEAYAVALTIGLGRLSRGVLEAADLANDKRAASIRKELIQVAAVATAWAEQLTK